MLRTGALLLLACPLASHAQWTAGGLFASSNHFQACAFHTPDSGLFVYGADNPSSGEGGIIRTDNGATTGGFYIWYDSPGDLQDIDVKVVNGFPYYLAAGHRQYAFSMVLKQYWPGQSIYQFDPVTTGSSRYYRAIRMRNDLVAFTGGGDYLGNGIIDMSTDTGATWTNIAVLPGQPVSRLHFVNDQLAFAATGGYRRLINNGIQFPDSGAIYRSQDGGLTWQQVHADPTNGFSDVAFFDALNGLATRNDGVILRSTDGGNSWSPTTVNAVAPFVLTSVTYRPDGAAFASGYRTNGTEGLILVSLDGGQTWDISFSSASLNHSRRVYDLYFHDTSTGYASTHIRPLYTNGVVTAMSERSRTGWRLVPNPASGSTVLLADEPLQGHITVMDARGAQVRRIPATGLNRLVLPLDGLAPGLYQVTLLSARTSRTLQLVVE